MEKTSKQELEMQLEIERLRKIEASVIDKKNKMKIHHKRRNAMLLIFRDKAMAAGIKVTEKEIDEYLSN